MKRSGLPTAAILTIVLGVVFVASLAAQARALTSRDGLFYAGGETPVGADFLVFYTAGRIVADGDGRDLYQPERQQAEQIAILGRDRGLAIFPYPAFVALPYAAIAGLSLPAAFVVATLAMIAASIAAIRLLATVSPFIRDHARVTTLALLVSQPFHMALFGGQTVAFTFLCLAGVYTSWRRDRDIALGIWLGLLLYKPQMAIVFVLLLLWRRRWRPLAAAAAIGAGLTAAAAIAAGPLWPRAFLDLALGSYYRENAILADGIRSLSIPDLFRHLAGGAAWSTALAGLVCLGILALLARQWRAADAADRRFPLQFAAAVTVTLLVSPHALFYEAALLALPLLLIVETWTREQSATPRAVPAHQPGLLTRPRLLFVVGFGLAGTLWTLSPAAGFELLAILPIGLGLLLWRILNQAPQPLTAVPGPGAPPALVSAD